MYDYNSRPSVISKIRPLLTVRTSAKEKGELTITIKVVNTPYYTKTERFNFYSSDWLKVFSHAGAGGLFEVIQRLLLQTLVSYFLS